MSVGTSITRRDWLKCLAVAGFSDRLLGCGRLTGADATREAQPFRRPAKDRVTLFLGGDVMTGRGIDQILARPRDIVVASIHWGSNWGYEVPDDQRTFARRLIDRAGVDIVHGHSSHHPRPIEVYSERLILYGCGDLLNDYEGISGHEEFRGDLALMYFPLLERGTARLKGLRMTPMQIHRFRLRRASEDDARWLQRTLNRESARFGAAVSMTSEGSLVLSWR